MTFDRFEADDLRAFLLAVDRHLSEPAMIHVIGGTAAALAFDIASTTNDVDTFNDITADLARAVQLARNETGLAIPLAQSTVAYAPFNYEDRLERQLPELVKLEVFTLEKHDLALSKAMRCSEHDLQQLREVHIAVRFDFETLVARFDSEMRHVMGDPRNVKRNFLELVGELFGELRVIDAERRLVGWETR